MSTNEGLATDSGPMNTAKSTERWIWGSLAVAGLLWVVAACTPWLNTWLGARGQIGDFLGGVSAPVFGFVGMVLVYRSFQAQLDANRLQIEALERERNARERDESEKVIEDGLRRLDQIIERACYVRIDEGGLKNPYRGIDGIYRFCVDCKSGGSGPYSANELMLDTLRHWLFDASVILRKAWESDPSCFEELRSRVESLYSFTLVKSLNTLPKSSSIIDSFKTDLEQLWVVKAMFDRALNGDFDSKAPA